MTDTALESRLYPSSHGPKGLNPQLPSIAYLEQELAKKHVTVQCLYEEYCTTTDTPVSRASFYRYFRQGRVIAPSMPMEYRGGDLVQVDYSGDWSAEYGHTSDVIIDRDDNLLCAACPIEKRDLQRANMQMIVDRVNGPLLAPEKFFKERHSGRVQVGSKWDAEFEDVCDREFFEVDLSEEIG